MEDPDRGYAASFNEIVDQIEPEWQEPTRVALAAVVRYPENVTAAIHLAGQMLAAQAHSSALALCDGLKQVASGQPGPLLNLSVLLDALGDRRSAITLAEEAVAINPLESSALLHLGGLFLAESLYHQAAQFLARHVSLSGATGDSWYMLSFALHQTGDIDRAIKAGERAVEAAPERTDFVMHLTGLLGVVGRYGDAAERLNQLLAAHPNEAAAWRSLAGMLEAAGQFDGALKAANRAVMERPDDPAFKAYQQHIQALTDPTGLADAPLMDWGPRERPRRRAEVPPPPNHLTKLARWIAKVIALLRWEMQTRFAHSRLGYVWGVMEPLSHVATIGVVFAFFHVGHPPVGENLFIFYITGVNLYMSFQRACDETAASLGAGKPQLQLPNVRILDVVMARVGLSVTTDLLSLVTLLGGIGLLGYWVWPRDFGICLAALLLTASLGLGVGMVNMAIRQFLPSWEHIWAIGARFLYFLSGIFYSPIVMPNEIREIIVWNPILQGIEMFRWGFYPDYNPPWLDLPYLLTFTAFVLLLGLVAQRAASKRLQAAVSS